MALFAAIIQLLLGAYAVAVGLTGGRHGSEWMIALSGSMVLAELMWAWAIFRGWSAARSAGRGFLNALIMLIPLVNVIAAFFVVGRFPAAANDSPRAEAKPVSAGAFRLYPALFLVLSLMIPVSSLLMGHRGTRMFGELGLLATVAIFWLTRVVVLAKFLSIARRLRAAAA